MRRSNTAMIIAVGIALLACCSVGYIFWDGYFLPYKPCRPISYPEGNRLKIRESESFSYETQDSINVVVQFYDEKLDVTQLESSTTSGQWVRDRWVRAQLEDTSYVYECRAMDINRMTQEVGCMYISLDNNRTHIEALLYRSSEEVPSCSIQ